MVVFMHVYINSPQIIHHGKCEALFKVITQLRSPTAFANRFCCSVCFSQCGILCVTTNRSQNGCLAFNTCILRTLPMTNRILRDDVLQQVLKSATLRRAQCPLQLDCRKCVGMLFFSKMQNIAAPSRRSKSFFCMRNAAIIGTEACHTATGTMSTAA